MIRYLEDRNGCSKNESFRVPESLSANSLLLGRDKCSLNVKVNLTRSLSLSMLLIHNTNTQQQLDDVDDEGINPVDRALELSIPVILVDFETGAYLNDILDYTERHENSRVRISTYSSNDSEPTVWEIMLLAVVILLGVSLIASLFTQCYAAQLRRRFAFLRRGSSHERQQTSDLEGIMMDGTATPNDRRWTTISEYDLDQYPIKVFRRKSTAVDSKAKQDFDERSVVSAPDERTESPTSPTLAPATPRSLSSSSTKTVGHEACSICIDDFEEGDTLRRLPCGHTFHQHCIDPWLRYRNAICPNCKLQLAPGSAKSGTMRRMHSPRYRLPDFSSRNTYYQDEEDVVYIDDYTTYGGESEQDDTFVHEEDGAPNPHEDSDIAEPPCTTDLHYEQDESFARAADEVQSHTGSEIAERSHTSESKDDVPTSD